MIPSIGRIVHYRLPDTHPRGGEYRAALITNVNGKVTDPAVTCNMHVFYDGPNDIHGVALPPAEESPGDAPAELLTWDPNWVGSVSQGDGNGQWIQPPPVDQRVSPHTP